MYSFNKHPIAVVMWQSCDPWSGYILNTLSPIICLNWNPSYVWNWKQNNSVFFLLRALERCIDVSFDFVKLKVILGHRFDVNMKPIRTFKTMTEPQVFRCLVHSVFKLVHLLILWQESKFQFFNEPFYNMVNFWSHDMGGFFFII